MAILQDRQNNYFLKTGKHLEKPSISAIQSTLLNHLEQLYSFYGNVSGVRIARKHIAWYFKHLGASQDTNSNINQADCTSRQVTLINSAFTLLSTDSAINYECISN